MRFKQYLSVLLLSLFGMIFTPKEYIHAFFGHKDNSCVYHPDLRLEKIHHHCKILQVNIPVFNTPGKTFPVTRPAGFTLISDDRLSFFQGIICPEFPPRSPPET